MRVIRSWMLGGLALVAAVGFASKAADAAAADDGEGWIALFDGKSLDGWVREGGFATYRVEDGMIVGTTAEGSPNTFLCRRDYRDFELTFEVKVDPRLNSGVQVRSHVYGPGLPNAGVVHGPQCEIAAKGSASAGRFYDEGRRGRWISEMQPDSGGVFQDDDWNSYQIVVQGDHYQSWVNGVKVSDFTDAMDAEGLIGLQVHGIARGEGPYEVRWRNIKLRPLKGE